MCCAQRRAVWAFARSLINHVSRGDLLEPSCRLLKAALVAVHKVDLDKTVTVLKGIRPRPVIDDGPIMVSTALGALGNCLGNPLQVLAYKVDAVVILDGSFGVSVLVFVHDADAVLGNEPLKIGVVLSAVHAKVVEALRVDLPAAALVHNGVGPHVLVGKVRQTVLVDLGRRHGTEA